MINHKRNGLLNNQSRLGFLGGGLKHSLSHRGWGNTWNVGTLWKGLFVKRVKSKMASLLFLHLVKHDIKMSPISNWPNFSETTDRKGHIQSLENIWIDTLIILWGLWPILHPATRRWTTFCLLLELLSIFIYFILFTATVQKERKCEIPNTYTEKECICAKTSLIWYPDKIGKLGLYKLFIRDILEIEKWDSKFNSSEQRKLAN